MAGGGRRVFCLSMGEGYKEMKILVTGGYGFMGSDFIRWLLEGSDWEIVNIDLLTYAGDKKNLLQSPRLQSYIRDICDKDFLERLFATHTFDAVVHFAAETHVDRSIENPLPFIHSNILGTIHLLQMQQKYPKTHFHYISTDEVYGDLSDSEPSFTLDAPFHPSSPYAASKASADLFCQAYRRTYGANVTISRSGNNFGPYQNREKLIPSMTIKALTGEDLTLYGDGKNKRDWLFVRDHSIAIMKILKRRAFGEIYHIGSGYERTNIEVCEAICAEIFRQTGKRSESKITFIQDRKGHDRRYSLEVKKTQEILDFSPKVAFNEGIKYVVSSLLHKSEL